MSLRAALIALTLAATPALAAPVQPFSLSALRSAEAAGKPVLVDVFAPWCPTCRAQAPTIDALARDPGYAGLTVLRLDYDHQVAEKKALGVTRQSTLIAFHGAHEVGRSVGVVDPQQIHTLAASALK